MEELRLAFLVIGACAIAAILFHGLWSVRKNASKKEPANLEETDWQDNFDDVDVEEIELVDPSVTIDPVEQKSEPKFSASEFDDLGLGPVRLVNGEAEDEDNIDSSEKTDTVIETDLSVGLEEDPKEEVKPKIYSSVVTQPKPEYAAEQVEAMRSRYAGQESDQAADIPEPPPFLLKTEGIDTSEPKVTELDQVEQQDVVEEPVSVPEKVSLANQVKSFVKPNKPDQKIKKRREPKLKQSNARTDQMRIDFDEPNLDLSDEEGPAIQEQEVLVLNVKASEDNPIAGAALLPMLLTLGFKFGDQDIFHRHVNSNGKGPVLFSLANMFKPGVFDIDNLENFNTLGVSLFMMLPIEGDPHQVFNMMHNAARKISEEFSAVVLDGRRNPLTKQGLQQYVEKIREFERQRLIKR